MITDLHKVLHVHAYQGKQLFLTRELFSKLKKSIKLFNILTRSRYHFFIQISNCVCLSVHIDMAVYRYRL